MPYHQELIVCLWFSSLVVVIVVPLLMVPLEVLKAIFFVPWKPVTCSKEDVGEYPIQPFPVKERRQNVRKETVDISAYISDGKKSCEGMVSDLSLPGICLVSPSDILDERVGAIGVLITEVNGRGPMLIKPKWKRRNGENDHIGGEVANNLECWKEYVLSLECT